MPSKREVDSSAGIPRVTGDVVKAQLKIFEFRLSAIVISLEIFRENILQLLQIYVNLG